ncbi:MAG: hypothetical protein WCC82_03425 [Nitrososphaeraceae archaeon]|jgi:hypothetical protein
MNNTLLESTGCSYTPVRDEIYIPVRPVLIVNSAINNTTSFGDIQNQLFADVTLITAEREFRD